MKKGLIVLLVLGIVCSELLSQELPPNFNNPAQFKLAETASEGFALGCLTGPNQFNLASSRLGMLAIFSAWYREDPTLVGDTLRTPLISNSSPSDGNNPGQDPVKKRRLVSGLLFAASWAATVVGDFFFQDSYRATTLIPVVGPWITLARIANYHGWAYPAAKALLVLSGVAQTGFATYFIISLTQHSKPGETKSVAISAGLNTLQPKNSVLIEAGERSHY